MNSNGTGHNVPMLGNAVSVGDRKRSRAKKRRSSRGRANASTKKARLMNACPVCNQGNRVTSDPRTGQMLCTKCGIVVSTSFIAQGPGWHNAQGDAGKAFERCSAPHDARFEDPEHGVSIDDDGNGKMGGTARILQNAQDAKWIRRNKAMKAIRVASSKLELPSKIVDRAQTLYRRMTEDGAECISSFLSAHLKPPILAALIYTACRVEHAPRCQPEICRSLSPVTGPVFHLYRPLKIIFRP